MNIFKHLTLHISLLACLTLAPLSLLAQDDQDDQDTTSSPAPQDRDTIKHEQKLVWQLLSAHHDMPTKKQLLMVSADPAARLTEIVQGTHLFVLQRRRALLVLSKNWPNDHTHEVIHSLMWDSMLYSPSLHAEAMYALVHYYGDDGLKQVISYTKTNDLCPVALMVLKKHAPKSIPDTTTCR